MWTSRKSSPKPKSNSRIASQAPNSKLLNLGHEFITVKVGRTESEGRTFGIHKKKLVCEKSRFFNAALNGQWKESKDGAVELPADDPNAFALWVNWIYTRTVPYSDDEAGGSKDLELLNQLVTMIHAYTLGDKIGDIDFADAVMDVIIHIVNNMYRWFERIIEATESIYRSTPESSLLREFLIDFYVHTGCPNWFTYEKSGLTPEYQHDLIIRLSQQIVFYQNGGKLHAQFKVKPCKYHLHKKCGRPCYTEFEALKG